MSKKKNTARQKGPFLPKFRHEILGHSVSFNVGPFGPIFLSKVKGMVLNCVLKNWLATKVDIRDFLLCLHLEMLDYAFLLKMQLRLKIDFSTKNRKLSQMIPRWCGNTLVMFFGVFDLFWVILPPISSEKLLFWPFCDDFGRFLAIYCGISPA